MPMRRISYQVVLPLFASLSLVAPWKIDKVNFFHHYIRVIAEVEERNCHEMIAGGQLAVLTMDQASAPISSGLFAFDHLSFPSRALPISFPAFDQLPNSHLSKAPRPIRGP